MPSSVPPPPGPHLMDEAARRGYTPETLPALRQYLNQRESGNMEIAKRIEENLLDFFSEQKPTGESP